MLILYRTMPDLEVSVGLFYTAYILEMKMAVLIFHSFALVNLHLLGINEIQF